MELMTAELALKAVENACLNVSITKDIILQSDLGIQYTSNVFQNYLREKGIIHSFSRKVTPMIMHASSPFILFYL